MEDYMEKFDFPKRVKFRYEKFGDITFKYASLEVINNDTNELIIRIRVTDDKELCFTFYTSVDNEPINLTLEQSEDILSTAKKFRAEVIRDEDSFEEYLKGLPD